MKNERAKLVATTRGHQGDDGRELKLRFNRDLTAEDVSDIVRAIVGRDLPVYPLHTDCGGSE